MDFFRRIFGYDSSQHYNRDPKENPPYPDERSWFGEGEDMMFDKQFQDMMQQMEQMMPQFHNFFAEFGGSGGFGIPGQDLPSVEFDKPPNHSSPRDRMLKEPDANSGDDKLSPQQNLPSHPHDDNNSGHSEQHHFRHPGQHFSNPFSMLEQIFGASARFGSPNFSPDYDDLNSSRNGNPVTSPRDALLKKQDQDLDTESKSSDFKSLLKEGPGYSHDPKDGSANRSPPGALQPHQGHLQPHQEPTTSGRFFTSSSVRRIVKPDGSVEERRTYRDSNGQEEVTVTQIDPDKAGPLLPRDDPFGRGGNFGSIFEGFFR